MRWERKGFEQRIWKIKKGIKKIRLVEQHSKKRLLERVSIKGSWSYDSSWQYFYTRYGS